MEYIPLEITVISAKDLKDNGFSKTDVYAIASIVGEPNTKQKTHVDKDGGKNPTWNFPMKFIIHEEAAKQNRLIVVFQLRCDQSHGDDDIGEVHVPVKELLDNSKEGNSITYVSYKVMKPSGKEYCGKLSLSFKFGEKVTGAAATPKGATAPVAPCPAPTGTRTAFPPPRGYPPPGAAGPYRPHARPYLPHGRQGPAVAVNGNLSLGVSGYPLPVAGHGYENPPAAPSVLGYGNPPAALGYGNPPPVPGYEYPPPTSGYGYPPQGPEYGYPQPVPGYGYLPPVPGYEYPSSAPGYGYAPQSCYEYPPVQQPCEMGLGGGLVGGATGGLLVEGTMSEAVAYDSGYAAFDNAVYI